jgi:hypothetical protein
MSTRFIGSLMLVSSCLALVASHLHARVIEHWPYDKLFKHADLVVIVRPLSVRDATAKDKAVPPGKRDYLVGVVTNFKVLHVVKGAYKEENLELVHFKYKKDLKIGIINGPGLVSFHTKEINLSGDTWAGRVQNEYMLFLKRGKDKRLEFVSGQVDPELSVKQLLGPLP